MTIPSLRRIRLAPLAVGLLGVSVVAWGDSGVGVDTWRANKLDPTGGQALQSLDPNGTSWLEPGQHRSPTGNLYGTTARAAAYGPVERMGFLRHFRYWVPAYQR